MTSNAPTAPRNASPADEAAIRATVDDYYLGWYDGDGDRMARALHHDLAKRGWIQGADGRSFIETDTYPTMVELAGAGRGRVDDPDERRYQVDVHSVDGNIAAAAVHAAPYVDYAHLVRTPDGWRIVNVLWCPA